jgi:type II secretory pathway pseudopilin PulG
MTLKGAGRPADHRSMRPAMPPLSDERGYTLVELMVAAVVLIVGVLGTLTLIDGANRTSVVNNARMGATNLAREMLEYSRSLDYDVLTDTQLVPALQAKTGTSGTPWKISRRGIEYTVQTDVCVFDDPKDNVAATPPLDVCTPQAPVQGASTNTTAETQPDDFRRVSVTLTWTIGTQKSITQTSLINNPAGGLGPRITSFETFTLGATQAVFPTLTTNAASVRWNSDGSPNGSGDSTGGPTTWTTTWDIGPAATPLPPDPATGTVPAQYTADTVLDGTYTVTAQAVDDRGIAGDSRAAILPLNRSQPLTVTGFEAGRNARLNVVELQWAQNPERDIIGYEVYNAGADSSRGGGNDVLACSTASVSATNCVDASPPSGTTSYYVVALDRSDITSATSMPRRSQHASVISVGSAGTPPAVPITLVVAPDPETGNPRLEWTHPDLAGVRFFRIYRDGCCSLSNRYDSTPTNGTHWVDPNPGNNQSHQYWVTAVGQDFAESDPSPAGAWIP